MTVCDYHECKNVFEEGELERESDVQILHIANSDKTVTFYNPDVIISVGYRVKSQHHELRSGGTPFYASRLHRTCYAMAGLKSRASKDVRI